MRDFFQSIFRNAGDPVALIGPDRRVRYANPAFQAASGGGREGVDVMDLVAPGAHDRVLRELVRAAGGESVLVEVPHPQDDGRDVVVEYRFFPLEGGTVGAIGRRRAPDEALQDQLGRAKAELQQKSRMLDEIQMELTQVPFTDPVTGVWNRLQVIERLTMEWSRTERWGSPLACMLVEVDRIGDLRRRLGDGTADELLRVVARRLKSVVRDHDIVGRYGGATFVVIAVHCDAEGAKLLARRMAEGVRQEPAVVGGRSIPVGLRIGASTNRSGDVEILEDLFSVAERALADARRQAVDFLCASESAS